MLTEPINLSALIPVLMCPPGAISPCPTAAVQHHLPLLHALMSREGLLQNTGVQSILCFVLMLLFLPEQPARGQIQPLQEQGRSVLCGEDPAALDIFAFAVIYTVV